MKSRGYGLKGRTAYSNYRFTEKGQILLHMALLLCRLYILVGIVSDNLYWKYFPSIKGVTIEPFTISFFAVYFAMCITPIAINKREDRKWKLSESKI